MRPSAPCSSAVHAPRRDGSGVVRARARHALAPRRHAVTVATNFAIIVCGVCKPRLPSTMPLGMARGVGAVWASEHATYRDYSNWV